MNQKEQQFIALEEDNQSGSNMNVDIKRKLMWSDEVC